MAPESSPVRAASHLLALVESSLEVLLMLTLLSRFFLQSVSRCLLWLDEGGDEEELVLARESSSDIPVWSGESTGTWSRGGGVQRWGLTTVRTELLDGFCQHLLMVICIFS